jgi:pSer/pThr/pTyr-binding forkhead associated (FHA) protein
MVLNARLEVQDGSRAGDVLPLDKVGSFTIGRGSDRSLQVDDKAISRRHCRVDCDGEFFWLIDEDSHNGTIVNGRKITKCMLFDGDVIRIGHVQMTFILPEEAGESAEDE